MNRRIDRLLPFSTPLLITLLVTLLGACSRGATAAASDTEAWKAHRKGLYYLDQGKHEESLVHFDEARAADLDDPLLHFDRSRALAELGRMEEATVERDLYHYKVKGHPGAEEFVECRRLLMFGREEDALEILDALVEAHPDSLRFRLQRALVCDALGDEEKALGVLEDCLERAPEDLLVLTVLGGWLERRGRHQEALALLDRADALEPDEWRITTSRALTLVSLGHIEEAVAAHARAAELDPENAHGAFKQAQALELLGDWQAALDAYDRALEVHPNHADTHSGRARALVQLGREEEAMGAYGRATNLAPDALEPLFERSRLHLQREEYVFAMQGLQMILMRDRNNVEALYMKGQLMHLLGNMKGAFFSLQRANELAPENELISALYEEVKKKVDDPDAKLDHNHQH